MKNNLINIRDFSGGMDLESVPNKIALNKCRKSMNVVIDRMSLERRSGSAIHVGLDTLWPVDMIFYDGTIFCGSVDADYFDIDGNNVAGLFKLVKSGSNVYEWESVITWDKDYSGEDATGTRDWSYLQAKPTTWSLSVSDGILYASNGTQYPVVYDGKEVRQWGLPTLKDSPKIILDPMFVHYDSYEDSELNSLTGEIYFYDALVGKYVQTDLVDPSNFENTYARASGFGLTNIVEYKSGLRSNTFDGPYSTPSRKIDPNGEAVDVYDIGLRVGGIAFRGPYTGRHYIDSPDNGSYNYNYPYHREIQNVKTITQIVGLDTVALIDGSAKIEIDPCDIHNFWVGKEINLWNFDLNDDDIGFYKRSDKDGSVIFTVKTVDTDDYYITLDQEWDIGDDYLEYHTNFLGTFTATATEQFVEFLVPAIAAAVEVGYNITFEDVLRYGINKGTFKTAYAGFTAVADRLKWFNNGETDPTGLLEAWEGDAHAIKATYITEPLKMQTINDSYGYNYRFDCYYLDTDGKFKSKYMVVSQSDATYEPKPPDPTVDLVQEAIFLCPFSGKINVCFKDADDDYFPTDTGNFFAYDVFIADSPAEQYQPGIKGSNVARSNEEDVDFNKIGKTELIEFDFDGFLYDVPVPVFYDNRPNGYNEGVIDSLIGSPKAYNYHIKDRYGQAWLWKKNDPFIYWTPADEPENFPVLNFTKFDDNVIAVVPVPETTVALNQSFSVIVFTRYSIHGISDDGTGTPRVFRVTEERGAVSKRGVIVHDSIVYFVSDDGVYVLAGMELKNITENSIDSLFKRYSFDNCVMSYKSDHIFVSFDSDGYANQDTDQNAYPEFDLCLKYDMRNNGWHYEQRVSDSTNLVKSALSGIIESDDGNYFGWTNVKVRNSDNSNYRNSGNLLILDAFTMDECEQQQTELSSYVTAYNKVISMLRFWMEENYPDRNDLALGEIYDDLISEFETYVFTNEYPAPDNIMYDWNGVEFEADDTFTDIRWGQIIPTGTSRLLSFSVGLWYPDLYLENKILGFVNTQFGLSYDAEYVSGEIDLGSPYLNKLWHKAFITGEKSPGVLNLDFAFDGVYEYKTNQNVNFLDMTKYLNVLISEQSGYLKPLGDNPRFSGIQERSSPDIATGGKDTSARSIRYRFRNQSEVIEYSFYDSKGDIATTSKTYDRGFKIHEMSISIEQKPEEGDE